VSQLKPVVAILSGRQFVTGNWFNFASFEVFGETFKNCPHRWRHFEAAHNGRIGQQLEDCCPSIAF